jgi:hypothetical protein
LAEDEAERMTRTDNASLRLRRQVCIIDESDFGGWKLIPVEFCWMRDLTV